MVKKRQKRPGPKSSKPVEQEKSEDSNEEPEAAAADKSDDKEATDALSDEPKEGSSPQLDDPLRASSVSSPTENESEKDSAEPAKKDSEMSESGAAPTLSEVDATPNDAPEEEQEKAAEPVEPAEPVKEVKEEVVEPSKFVLKLVPITQLLKPAVVDEPVNEKLKPPFKSNIRSKKSTSYIEISSDSDEPEQISLSSGSDDEVVAKKPTSKRGRDAGSSKENNGTKNKLSNGASKKSNFKEPMSPSKVMKNAKDFSVNLEKMPNNVNKLMKCYRVDEARIESLSETDDFENMISTSKIDRVALHKSKSEKLEEPIVLAQKRWTRKKTKEVSDDDEIVVKKGETSSASERRQRSERSSAKEAKLKTKTVIESSNKKDASSSSDEDEPITKMIARKMAAKKFRRAENTSNDESNEEPSSKRTLAKQTKKPPSSDSSSSDEKKLFKKKKKKPQIDDHAVEKAGKKRRDKSSSSEREGKVLPSKSRAKKTKETQASRSSARSKKETSNETKTRESSRKKTKGLSDDASNASSDGDNSQENTKKSSIKTDDSLESSLSEDDRVMQPISLGESFNNQKSKGISTSESDAEASKSAEEIPAGSDGYISETDILEEVEPPIVQQKFRNRNKFQTNSAFETLKQKIELRKIKQKISSEDESLKAPSATAQRTSRRKQNGYKESSETNNNKEDKPAASADEDTDSTIARAKRQAAKRKRLISSSEEEQENGDIKTPSKKNKMSSTEDTDFEAGSGDEKIKDSDDEKNKDSDEEKSEAESKNDSDSDDDDDDDDDDKPNKREKKDSSDYSATGTDDDEKKRPKDKKHKRIKKIASSDEDGENGDKSKSAGRKNIRKMMRADKLDVSTKEAAKIERERKQRIDERQKMYNQFYDERPEEAKEITKLVLDFDEKSKKSLLQVDKKLVRKLKPHQANGVKFMWDACFESLDRCEKDIGSGCILAHCMGLGKTLQVITLVHTLLKNTDETGVSRALVVCPLSTVLNWVNEFNIWLKDIEGREDIYVYEINKLKQNVDRANKLMEWHNDGGIMILSYDMFRNLTNDTGSRFRKKIKESLQTSLLDPGPDLVICDEGHLLKNEKTSISKAMMRLRTLRRIVLTGTPLQNNLKEYYCMVQFVKPNLLGKYQEYLNRFVNPITNGQYTDSTDYDIQIMRRRAHVLHKMLDGCVQRRDYSVLAPFLPPKHEYVISIKLTPMQVKLYKYYMEKKSRSNEENGGRKGSILFQDFQNLQRIWTAPLVLRYNSNRYEVEMQRRKDLESEDESEGSLKDFIDDSESAASTSSSSTENQSDEEASIHSDEPKKKKKKKQKHAPAARRTRAKAADFPSDHEADETVAAAVKKENPTEWWMQICPEEELNNLEHSSKLMLLMSILEECEAIGDKLLVFSQSLYSLDVIEHFLNYIDERTQMNAACASFTGSWSLGQDYFRLDGSTPVEQRNAYCKHFNSVSNPRARLFLISTRAGGLGINLVAANRVIIFDVSWNPSHDIQSIFRVYRFGQNKPCYVYRFLAMGTMEEKIYERQVTKQAISKRVIDEQQIDRHYNQNDLQELYTYDLEPDDERILPILPKDRLFAEMLKKFENMIYKYHEHDTLLENKEEETLGEDERKQAWEEFEAEKNRPQFVSQYIPQQPRGIGPVTSNNIFGIRTDVLLKLLSMKARLDNPTMTDSSVKQAIPLLMQELYRQMDRGELTLYQQLLALSSSLEVPQNYGGQFRVNENMMLQTYHSMNAMPSTSSNFQAGASLLQRQQLVERQQQLMRYAQQQQRQQILAQQLKRKSPPRIVGSVIEID